MKKTILLLALCASSTIMFAQNNYKRNPPQQVQRSWQRDYPSSANNEPWEYRNNQWHRRYMDRDHNNRQVDVYYDRNGRHVMSQMDWDRNDLPDRVKERIRSKYRTDNYSASRIERPGRGLYFQISLGNNRKVYLDERGREVTYH